MYARLALTSITVDSAQLKDMAVLVKAIRTGDFPLGLTAAHLAAIEIRPGETALSLAAIWGHYPAGATAADLALVKTLLGETVLHVAAAERHLPTMTTVQDLTDAVSDSGRSALDSAAMAGHFPPGTTIQHLATASGGNGHNALETAIFWGHLPKATSDSDLQSTLIKPGVTAWDWLAESLGSPGRFAAEEIALQYIYLFPQLLQRLHPASNEQHHDLVRTVLANPKLMPSTRQILAANPEILVMML